MRNRKNILLVGVAAVALLAGTGLVSAQNAAKDQGGAAKAKEVTPGASTQPVQGRDTGAAAKAAQSESKIGERAQSAGKPSADKATQNEKSASPSIAQKGTGQNEPGASRSAQTSIVATRATNSETGALSGKSRRAAPLRNSKRLNAAVQLLPTSSTKAAPKPRSKRSVVTF